MREWVPSTGMIACLVADESGATAVEYGLFAALIALGMLAGLKLFGTSVVGMFIHSNSEIVNDVLNR